MIEMLNKNLYTTILCQAYSPCGNYLVAGNTYNEIAIFDIESLQKPDETDNPKQKEKPKYLHSIENSRQICSLASTANFLLIGTEQQIFGYDWKAILSERIGKCFWTINLNDTTVSHEQFDVNSLWVPPSEDKVYVGCGDSCVYGFDLECGQRLHKFEGHKDYLHSVHGRDNQIISAGEDGFVYTWDIRQAKHCNFVEPHKNSSVARADLGKWVGAAALGSDWFVCGGGPRAALWHLRTLDVATVFDVPDRGIHVALLDDDTVILGGAAKHLYQMSFAGKLSIEMPVTATTTYSVLRRHNPNTLMTVAGSSPYIDISFTFHYNDGTLNFR